MRLLLSPTHMEQTQNKSRIPELAGTGGIAIPSVLCHHYLSMQGLMPPGSVTDRLERLVILGGTGVDLFFVFYHRKDFLGDLRAAASAEGPQISLLMSGALS